MAEEGLVACTQVIQAVLAVGRLGEPLFRAPAIADLPVFAIQAGLGKRVPLVRPELPLLRAFRHFANGSIGNIAEVVFRVNEVVA